jgi:hypothetical protein
MEILMGVLAAVAVAVVVALFIPVDLAVNVETSAEQKVRVRLVWLWGLLSVNLSSLRPGRKRSAQEKKAEGPARALRRMQTVLFTKGFPATRARFSRRLRRAVTMRNFRLRVRFGFDDPADTGLLLAATAPVMWLLRTSSTDRFSVEADFEEETFRAAGSIDARICPVRIVGAAATLLLSPPALRAAKGLFWK